MISATDVLASAEDGDHQQCRPRRYLSMDVESLTNISKASTGWVWIMCSRHLIPGRDMWKSAMRRFEDASSFDRQPPDLSHYLPVFSFFCYRSVVIVKAKSVESEDGEAKVVELQAIGTMKGTIGVESGSYRSKARLRLVEAGIVDLGVVDLVAQRDLISCHCQQTHEA